MCDIYLYQRFIVQVTKTMMTSSPKEDMMVYVVVVVDAFSSFSRQDGISSGSSIIL